jgi:hypothetical protein
MSQMNCHPDRSEAEWSDLLLPRSASNVMKNAFYPSTALHGSVAFPFVIPSEAEGSAVPRTIPGNMFFGRGIMGLRPTQDEIN